MAKAQPGTCVWPVPGTTPLCEVYPTFETPNNITVPTSTPLFPLTNNWINQNWYINNCVLKMGMVAVASELARIFPNPAEGILNIEFSGPFTGQIQVLDLSGSVVLSNYQEAAPQRLALNIGSLPAGVYIFACQNKTSGVSSRIKFTKLN